MEPTYTILGGDGNQYGPITLEQFREWVKEGRVNGATQVWRSDTPSWCAASALPELGLAPAAFPTAAPVAASAVSTPMRVNVASRPVMNIDPELESRLANGASWLYWIAGLSLVNSVLSVSGASWQFYIGLGITQVFDGVGGSFGGLGKFVALFLDILAAGLLFFLGYMGRKHHGWALIVGALLLLLDAGLVAIAALAAGGGSEWISFAFHVWAIVMIVRGFLAIRAMRG